MLDVADLLGIVDQRGPSTLDELVAAIPPNSGMLVVLDACVDNGWLAARAWGDGSLAGSRYCLTPLGRRIVEISARCHQAA